MKEEKKVEELVMEKWRRGGFVVAGQELGGGELAVGACRKQRR